MKKYYYGLLCLLPVSLRAVSIEADVSAFFPTSSVMQKIYGHVWPSFAVVVDHLQPFRCVKQLSFFGQVDYLFASGCSINGRQSTSIQLVPLTVGLKWIQPFRDCMEIYVGAAPKYYFMHVKNRSTYVPCSSHRHGCGGYAVAGMFFYPTPHCMVNGFLSYSYMNFKAPRSTATYVGLRANVSGFNLGAGIGYDF